METVYTIEICKEVVITVSIDFFTTLEEAISRTASLYVTHGAELIHFMFDGKKYTIKPSYWF